jgi:multidrug efflux pump subunit AcrA (membrane-fusion protein)
MRLIIFGILALGGAVGATLYYTNSHKSIPASSQEAKEPQQAEPITCVRGIGYVEPLTEVRGLSFKPGGVVRDCRVKVGTVVRRGDVLMVLEDSDESKSLSAAERELEQAKAERDDVLAGVNKFEIHAAERALDIAKERLTYAEREYERGSKLITKHAIAESDFETTKTAFKQASVEVRRADAQLQLLQHFVTEEHKLVLQR